MATNKYVSRAKPKADDGWEPYPSEQLTITVYVEDDSVDTGLVDALGHRIYRVRDRDPVGFRGRTL